MATKKKAVKAKATTKVKIVKQAGTQAYEKALLKMRADIYRLVQGNKSPDLSATDVGDEADQATQSTERELMFELSDNERNTLDAVEAALRKIDTGAFGQCETCHKKIAALRLKAIPHARHCIDCQAKLDRPRR
ncbi:MAG: TraR/DksA family transcriptional regulator [Elusimicrobia bacterium]|nr:TraR/DksA family transcriptional regulator [Elusimicrobiota bacterium]MBP9128010.1 TraR/DksA family transcriptional regulator [Elusimicrobiota bacterium]MBP9699014.1 TraR/DksA family transcriptional regulator [Elusimicrobiota bacterium]